MQHNDIEQLEAYALSQNRVDFCDKLVPGTVEAYFYRLLTIQNTALGSKNPHYDSGFKEMENKFGTGNEWVKKLRTRQRLLSFAYLSEKEKMAAAERMRREDLNISFTDTKPRDETATSSYPTVLLAKETQTLTLLKNALNGLGGSSVTSYFEPKAWSYLARQSKTLNETHRYRSLIQNATDINLPNLIELIAKDIKSNQNQFGTRNIDQKLTSEQLFELGRLHSDLWTNWRFVSGVLMNILPPTDVDLPVNRAEQDKVMNIIWDIATNKMQALNAQKSGLMTVVLRHRARIGEFDKDMFLALLKLPMQHGIVKYQYIRDHNDKFRVRFDGVDLLSWLWFDRPSVDQVVREQLLHFADNSKELAAFGKYIDAQALEKLEWEAQLMSGRKSIGSSPPAHMSSDLKELEEKVLLTFSLTNKEHYGTGEKVSLQMDVKNVSSLVLNVYYVDTLNYYQKMNSPIDITLNTDGLVANETQVIEYDHPKVRMHHPVFDFPSLANRRGVFLVEAIGNGLKSRALIRKGQLQLVHRPTLAGQVVTVMNEQSELVKQASVWVDSREFKSDPSSGEVLVPFTSKDADANIHVLVVVPEGNSSIAERIAFVHKCENYSLTCGIFVNRESLVKGSKAKVLLLPCLTLKGSVVSLSLLKDITVELACYTGEENTRQAKTFQLGELDDDKEPFVEFVVPEMLREVQVKFKAHVLVRSNNNKRQDLAGYKQFRVNARDYSTSTFDFFMQRDGKGYVLHCLGKTGEKIAGKELIVKVKNSYLKREKSFNLQTDANGCVRIEDIEDVEYITYGADGTNIRFDPGLDEVMLGPEVIHVKEGAVVQIPFMLCGDMDVAQAPSLVETRGDRNVAMHNDVIEIERSGLGGLACLGPLPPGDFLFTFPAGDLTVPLSVLPGRELVLNQDREYVVSPTRVAEMSPEHLLRITGVNRKRKGLEIELSNCSESTRVHVFLTRFRPAFSAARNLLPPAFRRAEDVEGRTTRLSSFESNRLLDEEYRYVLERRLRDPRIGCMLPRPGLLLNPFVVGDAATGPQQQAAYGQSFSGKGEKAFDRSHLERRRARAERKPVSSDANNDPCSLEFLKRSAGVLINLRPKIGSGGDGRVMIPAAELANGQTCAVLVAVDDEAFTSTTHMFETESEGKAEDKVDTSFYRDMTLSAPFDGSTHYAEQRRVFPLEKGKSLEIGDVATSEFEVYGSLGRIMDLYLSISKSEGLRKFSFLRRWDKLREEEKLKHYNEYACNELHFFMYMRDSEFFKKSIIPYLENKMEKGFMDRYFLGENLTGYLEPALYGSLNVLERILLAQRLSDSVASEPQGTLEHLRQTMLAAPESPTADSKLFDAAIGTAKLDASSNIPPPPAPRAAMEMQPPPPPPPGFGGGGRAGIMADIRDRKGLIGMGVEGPMEDELEGLMAEMDEEEECSESSDEDEFEKAPRRSMMMKSKKKSGSKVAMPARKMMLGLAAAPATSRGRGAGRARMREARTDAPQPEVYRKVETTKMYAETFYYKEHYPGISYSGTDDNMSSSAKARIAPTSFWVDYAEHVFSGSTESFISSRLCWATSSLASMVCALAVLDVPFDGEQPEYKYDTSHGSTIGLSVTAKSPAIVFAKQIKESEPADDSDAAEPPLVRQNLFNPADRTRVNKQGKKRDVWLGPDAEFLAGKVYGCQVVITNISNESQLLEVLLQVPQGAVPVSGGVYTKCQFPNMGACQTQRFEYFFYFPLSGLFDHYPVHISSGGNYLVSPPAAAPLNAVDVASVADMESWDYVSRKASNEQVIQYLRDHTVQPLSKLAAVAWRLISKDFFLALTGLLRELHYFDNKTWSYAFKHACPVAMAEYLLYSPASARVMNMAKPYLSSSLVHYDELTVGGVYHVEFAPLVNPRAHRLGKKRKIINERVSKKFKVLMLNLCYVPRLNCSQLLRACYYLLLLDRIEDARDLFHRALAARDASVKDHVCRTLMCDGCKQSPVQGTYHKCVVCSDFDLCSSCYEKIGIEHAQTHKKALQGAAPTFVARFPPGHTALATVGGVTEMQLQIDYLTAYFDFSEGNDLKAARAVAEKYKAYPVPRWQRLFSEVRRQLAEYDQTETDDAVEDAATDMDGQMARDKKMDVLSRQDASLDVTVDKKAATIAVRYCNIPAEGDSATSGRVYLRYYLMDIELLFSKDPFSVSGSGAGGDKFGVTHPNRIQEEILLDSALSVERERSIKIPDDLMQSNLYIEVRAGGLKRSVAYYASSLQVHMYESYGQLKVLHRDTRKPLAKVYAKVYFRESERAPAKFFKDGYTDIRGRFDFVSTSTSDIDSAERFAVLLLSRDYGAEVKTARPPAR